MSIDYFYVAQNDLIDANSENKNSAVNNSGIYVYIYI